MITDGPKYLAVVVVGVSYDTVYWQLARSPKTNNFVLF